VYLVGAIKTQYADLQNVWNGQLKKKLTPVSYIYYSCGQKLDERDIHEEYNVKEQKLYAAAFVNLQHTKSTCLDLAHFWSSLHVPAVAS
jgi:hypothetical protein